MKRIFGLDLVRTFAIFSVLAVHFFLNSGFYNEYVFGKEMLLSIFLRNLFYLGVPLFLLLTGYLNRNKTVSKKYYKRILDIYISFVFISFICVLFKYFYLDINYSPVSFIVNIFNFKGNAYSWYIEMFIGLFLLIPFLNILYNNLKTKKMKQLLIATLFVITSFCSITNNLQINSVQIDVIPNYWVTFYPLTYYFIGCYINEYKIKCNKKVLASVALLLLLIESIIMFKISFGGKFITLFVGMGGYNGIFNTALSVIVFLLLYNIKIKNKCITNITKSISTHTLDIYLFSYLTDQIIYGQLKEQLFTYNKLLLYYPLIFITTFVFAYLLSVVKSYVFSKTLKIFKNKKTNF